MDFAGRVVSVWKDYDPYGFADTYDNEREAVRDVENDLANGGELTVSVLLDMVEELLGRHYE